MKISQNRNIFGVGVLVLILPISFLVVNPGNKIKAAIFVPFDVDSDQSNKIILTKGKDREAEYDNKDQAFLDIEDGVFSIDFYGKAKPRSKILDKNSILLAAHEPGWAYASIHFEQQVNLWDKDIKFLVKGEKGSELLKIALIDTDKRTRYLNGERNTILTTDWQEVIINAEETEVQGINKKQISGIRFIVGRNAGSNIPEVVIYVKDLSISRISKE